MLNRDIGANRIPSLRMPTMGVYVPNMYLTSSNINGNRLNNDNQQVLVRKFDQEIKDSNFLFFVL